MSADNQGYISLHRKVMQNFLFKEKRSFSRFEAWLFLLMNANHSDNKVLLGNQLIEVKKGSFITSEIKLMAEFQWSKSKLRAFLTLLESQSMIEKITDSKKTTLTIVKYSDYQELQTTKKPEKNHERTAKELQSDTNNNGNNYNNENNSLGIIIPKEEKPKRASRKFVKPTIYELTDFIKLNSLNVDPEYFLNHYESNGWKVGKSSMSNWKTTLKNWHKREQEFKPKSKNYDDNFRRQDGSIDHEAKRKAFVDRVLGGNKSKDESQKPADCEDVGFIDVTG